MIIDHLTKQLTKLPGIGQRSARRMALQMVQHKEKIIPPLIDALQQAYEQIKQCEQCGNLDTHSPCSICTDDTRDRHTLCVVEDVADLWAIERSRAYKGLYHTLGGTLSAIDGRGPDTLRIAELDARARDPEIQEIILATNATVEGHTTAHYLSEMLMELPVKLTRPAHGIPMGGEMDYLDDSTLGAALQRRTVC
ncbi:MAG: recombination protein RecR [Rickettsiales bacterium]|nr:recombination protein RecR [Rickettsiales bacterium]|tara:strand:- start:23 stop:607 length:585 start_codon:yes stop_codon:yes gene_type:complete